MKQTIQTILLSSLISVFFLFIYHLWHKNHIIEIEDNFGKLVAKKEIYTADTNVYVNDANLPSNFVKPASKAKNAVVAIKAVQIKGSSFYKDKYERSNGSGVIISSNGYIVTNYHVIKNADDIEVQLEDNREYKCKIIGYDSSTDLAVLKVNAYDLEYLDFGDSNKLEVGEWVLAIGNPFKLNSSVTAGIVSAKARKINIFDQQGIESFIQTDAAINQGNSGGALINTSGHLIGINTAILTFSGKFEGSSFAIPSSIAKKVVDDLIEFGAVQRAWLGIEARSVNQEIANDLGLNFVNGVHIGFVERDGAAKEAGLTKNDIILSINGKSTKSVPEFHELIGQHRPGDEILVEFYRNKQKKSTIATLRNQLHTTDYIAVRKDPVLEKIGFELRDLDKREKNRLRSEGAFVVSVIKNSKIDETNMDATYIITSINKKKVKNVDDVIKHLTDLEGEIIIKGFYENWPGDYPYVFELD